MGLFATGGSATAVTNNKIVQGMGGRDGAGCCCCGLSGLGGWGDVRLHDGLDQDFHPHASEFAVEVSEAVVVDDQVP